MAAGYIGMGFAPAGDRLWFVLAGVVAGAGNGLTADGHYEVKYGKVGDLHVVAAGNEFDWIKAHFVGGPATCAKQ